MEEPSVEPHTPEEPSAAASTPSQPNETPVAGPGQVTGTVARVHWLVVSVMQVVMAVSMVLALYERQWLTAVVVLAIFIVMDAPRRIGRRFRVQIPAEFELLALVFVFASLFLGEVRGYYHRFWWWDIALHTTSGLLLGIFGFLLVYVLNQHERVELHMKAHFVALFAFLFAVAVGAIWEIFEFAMDKGFGIQHAEADAPRSLRPDGHDVRSGR